jgi:hypothetical protein
VAVPTTSDAGLLLFGIALAIAATALLAGRRAPSARHDRCRRVARRCDRCGSG